MIAIFILLPFLSLSQIQKSKVDTVKGRDTIRLVNKNSGDYFEFDVQAKANIGGKTLQKGKPWKIYF